jgi:two-component system NarL family sensor kinase
VSRGYGDDDKMLGSARAHISLTAGRTTYAIWHTTAVLRFGRTESVEEDPRVQTDSTLSGLDVRTLFRDSQARAARLKLLIEVSRELAAADRDGLDAAIDGAALKAARFAGFRTGSLVEGGVTVADGDLAIPLQSLAERGRVGVSLLFSAPSNSQTLANEEDAAALSLLVEMIEARLTVELQRRKEAELIHRLAAREKELEQVLSRVVSAQERERAAISADLHDGVAQTMSGLHRHLELVHLDLPPGIEAVADRLQDLVGVARAAVSDLRGVIAGLRPPSLDDLGVVAALREEAGRLERAGHQVVVADGLGRRLPGWLETLLFRVGQEAFNNAAKHAPGAAVSLDLEVSADRSSIVLSVLTSGGTASSNEDDPSAARFGLEIMRERLAEVAGRLEAGPVAGGFSIRASIPLAGL